MSENPIGPIASKRRNSRRRDVGWSVIIIIVAIIGAWAILTQVDSPPSGDTVATSADQTGDAGQSADPAGTGAGAASAGAASAAPSAPGPTSEPAGDPAARPSARPTTGPTANEAAPANPAAAASPTRASSSATATATANGTVAATPPLPPADEPAADVLPAVVVLNDSRIGGLARAAAARVEEAGFVVGRVGNYRGIWNTPATTIYYEPGHEAAAQVLRTRLPGVVRTLDIDDTQIPRYGKLLLVVTKEFPVGD